jgi:hypothetical protein
VFSRYGRRDRYQEFDALMRGHLLVVSFATVGELRAGVLKAGWVSIGVNGSNGVNGYCARTTWC